MFPVFLPHVCNTQVSKMIAVEPSDSLPLCIACHLPCLPEQGKLALVCKDATLPVSIDEASIPLTVLSLSLYEPHQRLLLNDSILLYCHRDLRCFDLIGKQCDDKISSRVTLLNNSCDIDLKHNTKLAFSRAVACCNEVSVESYSEDQIMTIEQQEFVVSSFQVLIPQPCASITYVSLSSWSQSQMKGWLQRLFVIDIECSHHLAIEKQLEQIKQRVRQMLTLTDCKGQITAAVHAHRSEVQNSKATCWKVVIFLQISSQRFYPIWHMFHELFLHPARVVNDVMTLVEATGIATRVGDFNETTSSPLSRYKDDAVMRWQEKFKQERDILSRIQNCLIDHLSDKVSSVCKLDVAHSQWVNRADIYDTSTEISVIVPLFRLGLNAQRIDHQYGYAEKKFYYCISVDGTRLRCFRQSQDSQCTAFPILFGEEEMLASDMAMHGLVVFPLDSSVLLLHTDSSVLTLIK